MTATAIAPSDLVQTANLAQTVTETPDLVSYTFNIPKPLQSSTHCRSVTLVGATEARNLVKELPDRRVGSDYYVVEALNRGTFSRGDLEINFGRDGLDLGGVKAWQVEGTEVKSTEYLSIGSAYRIDSKRILIELPRWEEA